MLNRFIVIISIFAIQLFTFSNVNAQNYYGYNDWDTTVRKYVGCDGSNVNVICIGNFVQDKKINTVTARCYWGWICPKIEGITYVSNDSLAIWEQYKNQFLSPNISFTGGPTSSDSYNWSFTLVAKDYAQQSGSGIIPISCNGFIEGLGCADPLLDRTSMKDGPCDICSKVGNPFDVRTGAKYENAIDLEYPLIIARNYSSKQRRPGMFGANWRSNYDKTINIIKNKDSLINAIIFTNTIGDNIVFQSTNGTTFTTVSPEHRQYKLSISDNQVKLITPEAGVEIYNATTQKIISENYLGKIVNYQYSTNGNLYKVVNQLGKYLEFSYNNSSFVTSITASNGDVINYNYYEGNVTTVKHNNIVQVTYEYMNSLLTGKLDGNGVKYASFTYDSLGRGIENKWLTSSGQEIKKYTLIYDENNTKVVQDNGFSKVYSKTTINGSKKIINMNINGNTENAQYNSDGNVVQKKDLNGLNETYNYDNSGRIVSYSRIGKTIDLTWNTDNNLITQTIETSSNGNRVTNYSYDENNNDLGSQVIGTTYVESYVYKMRDSYGRITQEENKQGVIKNYSYYPIGPTNNSGLLKSISVNTGSRFVINSYDTRGNPTSISVNGVTKTMTYDYKGRILTETVNGATNSYTYDISGNIIKSLMASGYQLNMNYDTAGRLLSITDNMNGSVVLTNDDYTDEILKTQFLQNNALVRERNKLIDTLGRTTETWNATNKTKKLINYYTRATEPDSTTDSNGINTNYSWNQLGQNISSVASNDSSQKSYDLDGNISNIIINNQTTSMSYDDLGRMVSINSPDTGNRYYTYSESQDTYTDANGTTHTVGKGVGGVPSTVTHINNNTEYDYSNYESYTYDNYGQITKIQSNNSEVHYTRNNLGQLTNKVQAPYVNGLKNFSVQYGYNSLGQKTTDTYPSGLVVTYGYTKGFITSILVNGRPIVSNVNYNSLLQEATSWTLGGRLVSVIKDTDGLLTKFSETGIFDQLITTDNEGNILSLNDTVSNNNFTTVLNDNYALVSGTINNKGLDYKFGNNSNLDWQKDYTTDYEFVMQSDNNKIESLKDGATSNVFNYEYDLNGNLKRDHKSKYRYDGNNNLEYSENTVLVNGYEDTVLTRYYYNGLNQRIAKQINTQGGQLTYFVYNESNQVIGEYDSNGEAIAEYVYFGLRPVAVKTGGNLNVVHTDYLGTPRVITSGISGGSVVWEWRNDNPYGNNKAQGSIEFNLRFAGQYYDSESGLHYNINRTYNPATGRYMQSDPIGLAGGSNTYNYVSRNPLNNVDPLGLVELGDYSLPQGVVDFAAGYGDSASLGGTKLIRNLGNFDSVNYEGFYKAGEYTELASGVLSFGTSIILNRGIKNLSRKAKNALRYKSTRTALYQSMKQNGCEVHHIQPLWGHPAIKGVKGGFKPTLFPTGNLPTWLNTNKYNLMTLNNVAHDSAHLKLIRLENFWSIYHNPMYTIGKFEINKLYNEE